MPHPHAVQHWVSVFSRHAHRCRHACLHVLSSALAPNEVGAGNVTSRYMHLDSRCPKIAGTHATPMLKCGATMLLGAEGCLDVGSCDQHASGVGLCAQHHAAEADGGAACTAPRSSAKVTLLNLCIAAMSRLLQFCPGVDKDIQLMRYVSLIVLPVHQLPNRLQCDCCHVTCKSL